jgi:hypothetical protein
MASLNTTQTRSKLNQVAVDLVGAAAAEDDRADRALAVGDVENIRTTALAGLTAVEGAGANDEAQRDGNQAAKEGLNRLPRVSPCELNKEPQSGSDDSCHRRHADHRLLSALAWLPETFSVCSGTSRCNPSSFFCSPRVPCSSARSPL